MALITETGAGLASADSLCSLVDATTYHASIGNASWAALASDAVREQMLRKATIYMGQFYRLRWAGCRVTTTQALDWPRAYVPRPDVIGPYRSFPAYYPSDAVPAEVAKACAELALRAASGDLAADIGQAVIEQTVGPITQKFAAGSPPYKVYRAVDLMLAPFLDGMGGTSNLRVVRA
jgi:hypothetical protein